MLTLQFTLAARYLWGRKLRSFLTTLAVIFGVLVIFGMGILLPTMMQAFQANLLAASGQVDVTISHKTNEAFSRTMLNRIKNIEGIRALTGSLSRTVNVPAGFFRDARVTAVTLTGIDPKAAPTVRTYPIKEGRFLEAGDEEAALITTSLAESLKLKLGDKLHLPTTQGIANLVIVGLQPARTLPGNEEILVNLSEAQKLLDLPGRINVIEANLDTTDKDQRAAIQEAIKAELGRNYVLGGMSSGSELLASMQMGQVAFNLFGFLALLMGGFIIFNTFRTIVAERRYDIGTLRAVGANRSTIVGLILVEGLVQGIVGTLTGMAMGYWMGAGLVSLLNPLLETFIHLKMGGPVITPALVVTTVVMGVGVTLLAGLLPAFSAGRVTPLQVLRPSVPESAKRTFGVGTIVGAVLIVIAVVGLVSGNLSLIALGGLAFLTGLVLVAPALVKPIASVFGRLIAIALARQGTGMLAQGNLTRQPSRSAITASATMIGLAIIVALGGMLTSITGTFLTILQKSLGSDYLLIPPSVAMWGSNVGLKSGLADRFRAIDGVGAVSTMRYALAIASPPNQTSTELSLLGIDPDVFPQVAGLNFQQGDKTAFAELANGRSAIANGIFAAQAGLHVGDMLKLASPEGEQEYRVAAVAGDYLNAKVLTAYISQDNLREDWHKTEDVFIQINLAPGADAAAVESRLKSILADYPQFKLISGKAYFEENRQLFNVAMGFYAILLMVLALPSLVAILNTLAIGVIERTREIGMLRAIGSTRPQVRLMVLAEALLLAAIGTAFGLVAGLYLGYVLVLGLSVGGFPVTYTFPLTGIVGAIAAGLVFGVLAALIPARQAAQLEIISALRYE